MPLTLAGVREAQERGAQHLDDKLQRLHDDTHKRPSRKRNGGNQQASVRTVQQPGARPASCSRHCSAPHRIRTLQTTLSPTLTSQCAVKETKRARAAAAADASPVANASIQLAANQHISSGAGVIRNLGALDTNGLVGVISSAVGHLAQRELCGEDLKLVRHELLTEVRCCALVCKRAAAVGLTFAERLSACFW